MTYEEWWYETGSGVTVAQGSDHEEHAKRIAEMSWRAALEDAANKFDGTTPYNPTAADGYANDNPEADARLIAAAPDLLVALEKINEWCCYASEEATEARLLALQKIGIHARAAIATAVPSEA